MSGSLADANTNDTCTRTLGLISEWAVFSKVQGTSVLPIIGQHGVRDAVAMPHTLLASCHAIYERCVQLTLPNDESLCSRSTSTAGGPAACPTMKPVVTSSFCFTSKRLCTVKSSLVKPTKQPGVTREACWDRLPAHRSLMSIGVR